MTTPWIDYDQHARTRPRDDLWGQVRRSVRGTPVAPDQIDMILAAIHHQLDLQPDDTLIDIGCGNGALSTRLHPHIAASLGIDVSGYLIGIAQDRFAQPAHRFQVDDAACYPETEPVPDRFTKALCYGSLAYFDDDTVSRMLRALFLRFTNVTRCLLGNLPDPARAEAFYNGGSPPDLRQPRSPIGVWRSAVELGTLAGPGWQLSTTRMPGSFFAAHYRFDALLVRIP